MVRRRLRLLPLRSVARSFEQDKVAQVLAPSACCRRIHDAAVGGALFGHGDRTPPAALTLSVAAMPTDLPDRRQPGYDVLGCSTSCSPAARSGASRSAASTPPPSFLGRAGAAGARRGRRRRQPRRGIGIPAGLGDRPSSNDAGAVDEWGWRIPFWIGLLVGAAGLVLRRGLGQGEEQVRAPERPPLLTTFSRHWRVLVYLAGISVFGAVGFYLMFVYIVSWLQLADGVPPAQALTINTISMALLIPAEVGMASLSDRIGRRPVLLAVTGLAVVAAWPLFWLLHGHEPWMVPLGQIGFVVLVGGYYGCLPAFMVEAVAVEVRCTAIALGYNVSLGLLGGLSPLAATWLVQRTDNDFSPAFMIMAAAAISFLVLLLFRSEPERVHAPLPR